MSERRLVNDYDLQQPWEMDKWLKGGKKIYFGDDKEFSIRYDPTTSSYIIRHEAASIDLLILNAAGLSVTGSISVANDAIVTGKVSAGSVSAGTVKSGDPLLKKTATPTVSNSPTEVTLLSPDSNHEQVIPISGKIVVGGTFASGETVTVTIIPHYSDGTTGTGVSKTFTATDTVDLTLSDLDELIKDGVYITEIGVKAATSIAGTSNVDVQVEMSAWQR